MRKKFTLINKSDWNTRQLRKLCLRVIKNKGTLHKRHFIEVWTKPRRRYMSGRATIGGRMIWMYVPKTIKTFDSESFASVLEHEIDHNLGLRHKYMTGLKDCSYAKDIEVLPKPVKEKPKIDSVQKRYDQAKANLKKAKTRFKRAETLLKKWVKKVQYYEKKGISSS